MQQRPIHRRRNILAKLNQCMFPVVAATLTLSPAHFARAASPATWEGTAGDSKWTTPSNWDIDALPTGDDLTIGNGTPGTITLNGNQTANSLTFTANFTLDAPSSTNTLTLSTGSITVGSGDLATINSILAGNGGLKVSGSGTLVLNAADIYNGSTTVNGGTLVADNSSSLNTGSVLTVGSSGSLIINANTVYGTSVSNSGNFTVSTGDSFSFNTSGASFGQSAGTLTVDGTFNAGAAGFNYSGGSVIGTVQIGSNTSVPTLSFGASAGNSGTFIIAGEGVTFSGANPRDIQSNQSVTLAPTAASGTLTASANISNMGSLTITGSNTSTAVLSMSTNTLTNTGTLTSSVSSTPSGVADFITGVLNNTTGTVSIGASLTETGSVTNSSTFNIAANQTFKLALTSPASTFTQTSGQISVAANGVLDLSSAVLSLNGGTISLAADATKPAALKLSTTKFIGSTTTGTIASGTVGVGQSPGYVDLIGATATMTIGPGTQPAQVIISAPVTDGGLVKAGAGALELSGASTYTLGTTVAAGTLIAANTSGSATGTGNVTLNAGLLASAPTGGIITGNVLAGTAAHTIAPGGIGTVGSLTIGGLTSTNLTTLNFDLGSGSGEITNGDLLTLGSGTVNIGSATPLTFVGAPIVGNDYRLIGDTSGSGTVVDAIPLANFSLPAAPNGDIFSLSTSVDPDYIDLVVSKNGPASLSWNNAGGSGDGVTWDTTNQNWNNGSAPALYTDGSLVTFNDANNATSNGGTNPNAYNVTLSTTVKPGSVTVNNSAGNYSISGSGTIAGTASLTKSGTGTLTLSTPNTYTGGTNVSAGLLLIEPTSSTTSALPNGPLSITGGAVRLAANVTQGSQSVNPPVIAPSSNVNLTSLSITGAGTFDINNNHVIINYGVNPDPISSIAAWIASAAYGSGATVTWTGTGITSSAAAANPSYGIGYADSADPGNPAGLSSGQIEIAYTLLGDTNLDSKVNGTDFDIMATNFNQSVTNGWDEGDFNYDGKVNGNDFVLLADNFNQFASQSAVSSADQAALDSFAAANGISLMNVPEPATAGMMVMAGLGIFHRRRRSFRDKR